MEDGDDDFGDLYADVEVEASSAMNGGPQFPQLQSASDETGKQKSVLEASSDKEDRASDGIDDYEDDDDDLDIVLNSDDDSNRHGEGFTIGRNNTNLRNGELEDEDDEEEFVGGKVVCKAVAGGDGVNQSLIGGKGVYNSNSMYKYLRSHSAIYASDFKGSGCGASTYLSREDNGYCQRMASRSMGPQSAQRFSLPRARNILDVNIDIFEQKPWKLPGADITDYFNFGFNEESWKLYCNQVDEFRHRGYMSSGTSASEPAQMEAKAYENGLQHEIDACDAWGKGEIGQGKGRAIVVEGSNVERPSSMDVRRQMDRDSDVIEITIPDRGDHCPGSAKEGLSHLDGSVPEASSNHEDVSGDDGTDHLSFSSASDDESVEGNHMEMEIYALNRSSNLRSSSERVTRGSEDHEIHQITDVYGHQRTRIDICGSGGTDEAIRTSDNTMEKSPAHHCKDLEDDTCIYRTNSYRHERRPSTTSFTELTRSVKPDYLHSEDLKRLNYKREHGENRYHVYDKRNHGDSKRKRHDESEDCYSRRLSNKRKSGDHRYHERCNGPVYNSRTRMDSEPKLHHENGDFCSRRPDDKRKPGERRHSNPVYNRRACGVPKLKAHRANDDLFPVSDIEGTYDVRSPLHHNRRNERWHLFDPYDEDNILYSKELELPSDYYGERFSGYEDWDSLAGDLGHEGYERFGAKMDLSVFRSSEEEEYYDERRRYMEDDKMMARDWCHYERELDVENVNFFSSQEFGWQNSKYPPYLKYRKGAPWRRKGDNMHLRNEGEDDECFLEQEYSDDIQGEKFRYLTYEDRERDAFESGYVKHVAYTRWEFRGPGKNKKRAGSPSSELNIPSLKRDEDSDPKYKEGRSFASRSSEESYINNGRWHGNMTPRKNLYGRHRRPQWAGRSRYDSSLGGYSEPFDREGYTIDINDRVDVGRRRRHWQSGMQCEADEIMLRHDDANFHAERAPFSFEKVSRRKSSVSEHVPDRVDELVDVPHVESRIYKQREGTSIDKFERTSNVTCEGSPKQRFRRSRDSPYIHLVDGYNTAEELFDDVPSVGHKYEHTIEVKRGDKFNGTSNLTHGRSYEWSFMDRVDSLNSRLVDGSGHVEELVDDSHAEVCRYKETKEVISGNKCSKTYGKSGEQPSLSCWNSHLVVRKGKSSKQPDRNINDQKKHTRIDPDSCPTDNVALAIKTNMADGGSDLEEGQILTREPNTGPVKDDTGPHDTKELHNQNKKTELDDSRILEAMAKMEKRKARFQKPVTIRSDGAGASASAIKPATVDSGQETAATKQQRPARKRRWGGS